MDWNRIKDAGFDGNFNVIEGAEKLPPAVLQFLVGVAQEMERIRQKLDGSFAELFKAKMMPQGETLVAALLMLKFFRLKILDFAPKVGMDKQLLMDVEKSLEPGIETSYQIWRGIKDGKKN